MKSKRETGISHDDKTSENLTVEETERHLSPEGLKEMAVNGLRTVLKKIRSIFDESENEIKAVKLSAEKVGTSEAEILAEREKLEGELEINNREIAEVLRVTVEKMTALVDLLSDENLTAGEMDILMSEFGVGEMIGSGAFNDTFEIEGTNSVFKILKLNYFFDADDAVKILARHRVEADRLKEFFDDFVPDFHFICPEKFREVYEEELVRIEGGGVVMYDLPTFIKIQFDRRLQEKYARYDVPGKRTGFDVVFGQLGRFLKNNGYFRQECAGALIMEQVRGVTFQDLMNLGPRGGDCLNWDKLRNNVGLFIQRLSEFNELYAFLWHRLDSDNVMIEVSDDGQPTGEIKIIDLNFTERPLEIIRRKLVKKTDDRIIKPLKQYFGV